MDLSFRLYLAELRQLHDVLSSGDFTEWLPLRTECPNPYYMYLRGRYSAFNIKGHKVKATSKAEHVKLAQVQTKIPKRYLRVCFGSLCRAGEAR